MRTSVVLVDANLLLYAEDRLGPHYEAARLWWDEQLSGGSPVGLSWPVIGAFVRIGTNPRIFTRPLTLREAVRKVQSWLEQPCTRVIVPSQRHWAVFASCWSAVRRPRT